MSDHSISIVPKVSVYPEKENKAKEILDWLVSLDIVMPTSSDCILGSEGGHAISSGAKSVTAEPEYLPFDLITNGLEIVTARRIFDNGGNGVEAVNCPNCNQDISNEDWDFLTEWADYKSNDLTCPLCKVAADIHKFVFIPDWGFSDLGFTFYNWSSLTDGFVNEFRQRLGCDINVVYCRI